MENKSILIIIYDNVEGRLLTSRPFIEFISKEYSAIHIACLAGEDYFDQLEIGQQATYYQVTFVKPDIKKARFRLQLLYYHFCRIHKSESSRQKFLELLGKPPSYFLNYKNLSWLFALSRLGKWMERKAPKSSKNSDDRGFDTVLFPRPDSSYNYQLYSEFVSPQVKTVVLCRNFDTPTLKGIHTHRFDQTLYFDSLLKDLIVENISDRISGQLVSIPYYIDEQKEFTIEVFKVIFAISQSRFVQNQISQIEIIDHLLFVLKGREFQLDIRVHFEERHNYDRYLDYKNVTVTNDTSTTYTNNQGEKVNMFTRRDIANYLNEIGTAQVLFTHSSTIVYDASKLRTNAYFLDLSDSNKLHDREHLKLLTEVVKGTVRTKQKLTEVIEQEYKEFHAYKHNI